MIFRKREFARADAHTNISRVRYFEQVFIRERRPNSLISISVAPRGRVTGRRKSRRIVVDKESQRVRLAVMRRV